MNKRLKAIMLIVIFLLSYFSMVSFESVGAVSVSGVQVFDAGYASATLYAGRKLVRTSNGTLICAYMEIVTKADIFLSHSLDGGVTWRQTKRITYYGTYNSGAPYICINSTDIVHIVWSNQTGAATYTLMYATYDDALNTSVNYTIGDNMNALVCPPSIAVDGSDNVHVAWVQRGGSTTYATRYQKKTGSSWGSVLNLSAYVSNVVGYTDVVVNSNNDVYVFWSARLAGGSQSRIRLKYYWNGNSTWTPRIINITTANNNQMPNAVVLRNGSLFLVWYKNALLSTFSDVQYSRSVDAGSGWMSPSSLTSGGVYTNTYVSVSLENATVERLHVVWQNRLTSVAVGTPNNNTLRYTNSSDFGVSWSSQVNLTLNTTDHTSVNLLWSWYPKSSGLSTNKPKSGFCYVWTNGTKVWYGASNDLLWSKTDYPPTVLNPSPVNGSTGVSLSPTCSVLVTNPDGWHTMNVYWWTNQTGAWVLRQVNSSVGNGTYRYVFSGASEQHTWYWWKVAANDDVFNVTAVYHFKTESFPPIISEMQPANGSYGINVPAYLGATVNDSDGDIMTTRWYSNGTNELLLRPEGNGSRTYLNTDDCFWWWNETLGDYQWNCTPHEDNWECVDDTNISYDAGVGYPAYGYSNNASNYVHPALTGTGFDVYKIQNHTTETFTIYNVTLYAVFYFTFSDMGPSDSGKITLKVNNTFYNTTVNIGYGVWKEASKDYSMNPFTGIAWTWADIDNMEVGISLTTVPSDARCSSVYVKVNAGRDAYHYSGHYRQFGYNSSNNATLHQTNNNFSQYNEKYYWYIVVSDVENMNTSNIFWFKTVTIMFSNPSPANESINVVVSPSGIETEITINYTGDWNATQKYENYSGIVDVDVTIAGIWAGMNFTVGYSSKNETSFVVNVSLYLKKIDTGAGTLGDFIVGIRDASDLNGPDLTNGSIPAEDISADAYAWYNFSMTPYPLLKGKKYFIDMRNPPTLAVERYIDWAVQTAGTYAKGNYMISVDGGETWYNDVGENADGFFKVWCKNTSIALSYMSNSSGTWHQYAYQFLLSNGTYNEIGANFTSYSTMYWWKINGSFFSGNSSIFNNWSAVYHFTTQAVPVISIDINKTSFSFGIVIINSIVYSNVSGEADTFRLYNNGTCNVDVDVNATNLTATGVSAWVLSSTNGINLYKMEIYNSSTNWRQVNLTKDTWLSNMVQATNKTFNVRVTTPTVFYSGKQMSGTFYMVASIH